MAQNVACNAPEPALECTDFSSHPTAAPKNKHGYSQSSGERFRRVTLPKAQHRNPVPPLTHPLTPTPGYSLATDGFCITNTAKPIHSRAFLPASLSPLLVQAAGEPLGQHGRVLALVGLKEQPWWDVKGENDVFGAWGVSHLPPTMLRAISTLARQAAFRERWGRRD